MVPDPEAQAIVAAIVIDERRSEVRALGSPRPHNYRREGKEAYRCLHRGCTASRRAARAVTRPEEARESFGGG
jgi:hypothetical protein